MLWQGQLGETTVRMGRSDLYFITTIADVCCKWKMRFVELLSNYLEIRWTLCSHSSLLVKHYCSSLLEAVGLSKFSERKTSNEREPLELTSSLTPPCSKPCKRSYQASGYMRATEFLDHSSSNPEKIQACGKIFQGYQSDRSDTSRQRLPFEHEIDGAKRIRQLLT